MTRGSSFRWWPQRVLVLAALLCLPLLPRSARAQGPPFLRDTLAPGEPIQLLLDHADELKLSGDQVARLRQIKERLEQANAPLVGRLVQIRHQVRAERIPHPRNMTPEQRQAFRGAVQQAHPLMQAIRANNVRAMEELGAVLRPEQKGAVRDWIEHAAPGSGQGPGGRIPHGKGASGDRGR